jgi:hypothetical protein
MEPEAGFHEGLSNPANIASWREDLFNVALPIELSEEAFATYWPYVSNIWAKDSTRTRAKDGAKVTHYDCRLRRGTWAPKGSSSSALKSCRDGSQCDASVRVEYCPHRRLFAIQRTEGSPGHSHTIDQSDQVKRNDALKLRVELLFRLQPQTTGAQVLASLRAAGRLDDGSQQLRDAGGTYLTAKDCNNWGRAFTKKLPELRTRGHNDPAVHQVHEARKYLEQNGWETRDLGEVQRHDGKGTSLGLAFAMPARLQLLGQCGWLTLMDSTHKTNYLRWFLYTLVIRDSCGSFLPCAHLLLESEDSEILAAGLRELKSLSRSFSGRPWAPRWVLTDDSAAEQLAIKKAFPGLEAGEMLPDHILCTVHSDRTMRRKIKDTMVLKHLRDAMYSRSELGCDKYLALALARADAIMKKDNPGWLSPLEGLRTKTARQQPGNSKRRWAEMADPEAQHYKKTSQTTQSSDAVARTPRSKRKFDVVKYIWNEWCRKKRLWALYARQHSPLLLQVTTTNIVESWHNSLKAKITATTKLQVSFSLQGVARSVHETSLQWFAKSRVTALYFRTKTLSEARLEPGLGLFPFPVQKLLARELQLARQYVDDCVELRCYDDELTCSCDFWRKYSLPCVHLWHRHLLFGSITMEAFAEFASLFEESGFEIYERFDSEFVEKLILPKDEAMLAEERDTLHTREILEQLRAKWFNILEETSSMETSQREAIRVNWVGSLARALGPFMRATARSFLALPRWDGALEQLQEAGFLVEGESQFKTPSSRAPPLAALGLAAWLDAGGDGDGELEYAQGDDQSDGDAIEESDSEVIFDEMDEAILAEA